MKWLIENKTGILSDAERERKWESTHKNNDYNNVWSMTGDAKVKEKILHEIANINHKRILIPGCGSRVELQNYLCDNLSTIDEIVCTDFSGVIEVAQNRTNNPKIKYVSRDSKELGWEDEFDVVIIVNSIVSESDIENRKILKSCYNALKNGASFIGFFPTVICGIDVTYLLRNYKALELINMENSTIYEPDQDMYQIMYSPLRLKYILKEANFKTEKFEIFFADTDYFMKQMRELYGIAEDDIFQYELFIKAQK